METTFVRDLSPLNYGERVVLFAPPGDRPCYQPDGYCNPYVRFGAEENSNEFEDDPREWSVVVGTMRAGGMDRLGHRDQSAVQRTFAHHNRSNDPRLADRYSEVAICLIKWDTGGEGSYLSEPLDMDLWRFSDFEKYRSLQEDKRALGAGFKMEELDKVILPETSRKSIISVLKQHQHAKKIFETWGLGEIIEYGKGMTMLFWGPPGTGKTWAATCIARAMNKPVKIVDSAQLQSSEPGGFERTLQALFAEAKKKKEVLFIDECDSLVQDRTGMGQIISAETNCLLKEIENFEGILILATNRINELDKALERRISMTIEFPKPNAEQRLAIWTRMLPSKMPLAENVDKKVLADDYDIAGGFIKNAVLGAARLAVTEDAEEVSMEHFTAALGQITSGQQAFAQKSTRSTLMRGLSRAMDGTLGKSKTMEVEKEMTDIEVDKVLEEAAPTTTKRLSRKEQRVADAANETSA